MEIDRKTLKALAADTRLDILKSLSYRRKMPSELSKELNLAPSTVTEHLNKLEEANLVKRGETGHKWIYYSLTDKGENLIKPSIPVQFILVLSISLIVIFAGFVYVNYTSNYATLSAYKGEGQTPSQEIGGGQAAGIGEKTTSPAATGSAAPINITEQEALNLANNAIKSKCNVTYTKIEKRPWSKGGPGWDFITNNCPNIENYNYSEAWRAGIYLNQTECSLPYPESINCTEVVTFIGVHGEFVCPYGLHRYAVPGLDKLENVCK